MAGTTGLEPATSAVTGQRSNQLSYVPYVFAANPRKSQNLLAILMPTLACFHPARLQINPAVKPIASHRKQRNCHCSVIQL